VWVEPSAIPLRGQLRWQATPTHTHTKKRHVLWKMGHLRIFLLCHQCTCPAGLRPLAWMRHAFLCGRVALTPLVHVCAAPAKLCWGPLLLQAMEARMVPSVAVVGAHIGFTREATRRKARRRRQLRSASPPCSLAAKELLGTRPPLHPLQRPLVVTSVAIKGAWRCGADRRRRWGRWGRGRWGWSGWGRRDKGRWGWSCGWGCGTADTIVRAAPSILVQ